MISSDDLSVKVRIKCPICKTQGQMNVEKNIVENSRRGITAINVEENLICEHSFVIYMDKNLTIRDSFVCDFKVTLPEINVPEYQKDVTPINFNLGIIKLNLLPSILTYIIKTILMGEKLVIISEQDHLNEHYQKFLEYIFGDSFNIDITYISVRDYKKNSKEFRDHIVLNGAKVLRDNKKLISQTKLKIEHSIVEKFYRDYDEVSSLILFKNEINKIERIIHQILKYHMTQNPEQEFRTQEAITFLSNLYNIKIPVSYLNFLLDIIESYFKMDLNRPSKTTEFLGLI